MFRKHRPPAGLGPGTLVSSQTALPPKVEVIEYDEHSCREFCIADWAEIAPNRRSKGVSWISVKGLADVDLIRKIGEVFGLHPLVLEDVVNVPQRPKCEDHDDYIFVVTSIATMPEVPDVEVQQLSFFFGPHFLISFHEKYDDIFDNVRERLRHNRGGLRKSGSDFLAHAILDDVIDEYYPILEELGEYVEDLEDRIIENPTRELLPLVYEVRREMLTLRRAIFPQRELLTSLIRDGSKLIKKPVLAYLRDCYDHCSQIIDVLESYREICSSLMDVYLSGLSAKLNEVMKVLTMIATIFIPLSFIAGVYGMNFDNLPELHWKYGYAFAWALMIGVAGILIFFFYRKGWLSSVVSMAPDNIPEEAVSRRSDR